MKKLGLKGAGRLVCLAVFFCQLLDLKASEIRIALSSAPNNLAPFYSTDANSQNIHRLVHLPLIDFNAQMKYSCVACESFAEKMEGKKQIIRFVLKKDLTFFDGTPVSVNDVVLSYKYFAKDEVINSTFKGSYESLEDVKIIDDSTLDFVFTSFSLENLSNLTLLKIIKLKTPPKSEYDPMNIVGAGPYQIKSISPLEIIVAPRDLSRPVFIFKVVKDETTLALKLMNNEVDMSVANMSPRKVEWLKNNAKNLKVWERESSNFLFLGINHKREFFKDRKVREALSLLVPRQELLKYKLKNTAKLATSMFSKAFSEMYQTRPVDVYNPAKAHLLLKEAGFLRNKNGFYEKDGLVFDIDWKVSNNKASIEVIEVIKNFFEQEGIKVSITIQEWGTFMSNFKGGKFDMVISQWVGFTGPEMLRFVFHSENIPPKGGNRIGFNNQEFDRAIDLATVELDHKKRIELYKKAENIANQEYAYINMWHPNVIFIAKNCLDNIALEPNASFYPLLNIKDNCGK